jgi:acyl-CoA synthetase (AMP-forming)/AMP-acid ligase II
MIGFCSGAGAVLPAGPSTEALVDAFRAWRPTQLSIWPHQVELIKDHPDVAEALKQLKPLWASQFAQFGLIPPELNPNQLGMTESLGPHSGFFDVLPPTHVGSFGTSVSNTERRIVDPETGRTLPPGQLGVLQLRGGTVMLGMHRKERSEVFTPDGFYDTEDLAILGEDGHLFFKGRGGDMVKVNGANVAPAEVDRAIRAEVDAKSITVMGLEGSGTADTLLAVLVLEDGATVSEAALKAKLKTQLAGYKVPRHIVVLPLEDLPMTASGKVYMPRLRELMKARLAKATVDA